MFILQNSIANLFTPALLEAMGWTIIHSLWQGALVAVLLAVVLSALKNNASANRYVVSVTALFAMLQISLFTFFMVYEPQNAFDQLATPFVDSEIYNHYEPMQPLQNQTTFESYLATISQTIQANLIYIVSLWFVGVLLFSIKFLGGLLYVNRLKTKMVQLAPESWQIAATEISHKLRLRKNVKVLLSDLVTVPTAIGLLKPIILMPASLQTGLSISEIESILAHELAHIRRNDYLINIFQSITEILFFYHPAVWWISSVIREERENCCDDMAVSVVGDSMLYSRTLARMNEMAVNYNYTQTALAFHGKKGSLLNRIKRLFVPKNENNVLAERFAATTIILVAMLLSLTANAGLVADKAVQLVKNVQENLPTLERFEPNNMDYALTDTTKKKKKIFITIDEDGKADTVQFDIKGEIPPIPPMPPMPPMPPDLPDLPELADFETYKDFDFSFDFDHADFKNQEKTVRMFRGKNGQTIIIDGREIDIDSITRKAKTVNVENENGKVKIIVNGKVVRSIDTDSLQKKNSTYRVYTHSFAPKFRQNNKAFDSLRNTKEYKKKREKYEKALKEYQDLMKEYGEKMQKADKSQNSQNSMEWRAYHEAMRDYAEVIRENQEAIRIETEVAREEAHRQREEHRRMAHEDKRKFHEQQRQAHEKRLENLKAELKKDGFEVDKLRLKINNDKVEINEKEVSKELAEKYLKMLEIEKGSNSKITIEN
jgi:bla regulator protein BlaR1